MPFCGNCGGQISGKFCGQCGAKNEYTAPAQTTSNVAPKQIEIKNAPAPGSLVQVLLVDSTGKVNIDRGDWPLTNGFLPIREICQKFRIKDPVWHDADIDIGIKPDGLSDFGFSNIKIVRIRGARV